MHRPAPPVDNWQLLAQAVTEEADHRFHALRERITTSVGTFQSDAYAQIESQVKGKTEGSLFDAAFSGVVNVLVAVIPGGALMDIGKEGIKAFIDEFKKGAADYANMSSAGRLDEAKDEMRRRIGDLYMLISSNADLAVAAGHAALPQSLAQFVEHNPQYRHINANDIPTVKDQICDWIGVRDEWPGAEITKTLWASFNHDLSRVVARVHFYDMDSDGERLVFLIEKIEPTTDVGQFLEAIHADGPYWQKRVHKYHETFPGEPADPVRAYNLLLEMVMQGE